MLRQSFLDVSDGLSRVKRLGTNLGAVHDGVTAVQFEGIVQVGQAFRRLTVAGVFDPTVGLHQYGRAQVLVRIPPVRRTRGGATRAEDALVHAVQFGAVFLGLQELGLTRFLGVGGLQPRFDGTVLLIKVTHVGHQILEDKHVRQGIDLGGLAGVFLIDVGQARQGVDSIDVHGTRSTDPFPARSAETERRVLFVLDFDQRIQYHGSAIVQIHRVRGQVRFLILFRIPTINLKVLDTFWFGRCRCGRHLERTKRTNGLFGNLFSCSRQWKILMIKNG